MIFKSAKENIPRTISTKIGSITVFTQTNNEFIKVLQELPDCTDDSSKVRIILMHSCYHMIDSNERNTNISYNELNELSEEEIEKIAELFLLSNQYLYRNQETKTIKTKDNKIEVQVIYTSEKTQRNSDERNSEILLRTFNEYKNEQNEKWLNVSKTVSNFSKGLSKQINETLNFGHRLDDRINKLTKNLKIPKNVTILPEYNY